jgi:hypothetical protein
MTINYNEPITFGRSGTAVGLNCSGVDFSEDSGRSWTLGSTAEMDIQLPFARQDVVIQLEASPFLVPDILLAQNVFIFLGGLFVGYHTLKGHVIGSFPVSRGVVSGRVTRLSLVLPNAASPRSMSISADLRELGIYLTSINFRTVP